jgi:hypothetical protein
MRSARGSFRLEQGEETLHRGRGVYESLLAMPNVRVPAVTVCVPPEVVD